MGVWPGQRYPLGARLDPYAKAIEGTGSWDEVVFPCRVDDPGGTPSDGDSAPRVPRSVVTDAAFTWGGDRATRPAARDRDRRAPRQAIGLTLPRRDWGRRWAKVLDTTDDVPKESPRT